MSIVQCNQYVAFCYGSLLWRRYAFMLFSILSMSSKLAVDNSMGLFNIQIHKEIVQNYANIIEF